MSYSASKVGQLRPESAEIAVTRVGGDAGLARITIGESGQQPMFDHELSLQALGSYRREPFDDGMLKVSYLFSRDRASLQFNCNGEERRLVILREPFERLLGSA